MKNVSFLAIPKSIFTDEKYDDLTNDERIVYAYIAELAGISKKNGEKWREGGRVFCYFTIKSVQEIAKCSHGKAVEILKHLEEVHLITRIKQGQGKPARVYVHEPQGSDIRKPKLPENGGLEGHQLDSSKTEAEDAIASPSNQSGMKGKDGKRHPVTKEDIEDCKAKVHRQIAYDAFKKEEPLLIEDITGVMVEVLVSQKPTFEISGTTYSAEVVKERLRRVDPLSIRRLIDGLRANGKKVKNPQAYLLKCFMQEDFSDHLSMPPVSKNRRD